MAKNSSGDEVEPMRDFVVGEGQADVGPNKDSAKDNELPATLTLIDVGL